MASRIPEYRVSIVDGSTIMELEVDVSPHLHSATFSLELHFDDGEGGGRGSTKRFELSIPDFVSRWCREFVSSALLGCSKRRKARLAAWEETVYFHLDRVVRRLRGDPGKGIAVRLEFEQTSPQALEDAGLWVEYGLATSGGNLLKRIEKLRRKDWCSICLEDFGGEKDLTSMTKCSHVFHYTCLAEWLPRSRSCPLCRRKLNWNIYDSKKIDDPRYAVN